MKLCGRTKMILLKGIFVFEMVDYDNDRKCAVVGCANQLIAKGLCSKHYHKGRKGRKLLAFKQYRDDYNNYLGSFTNSSARYYHTQAVTLPKRYNKKNIICQWLKNHHTKRSRSDKGLRN